MKNKLMLFVYLLGSLISSIGYIQAQCNTCDSEIKTGSGTLVLSPNNVTCILENLTFSDIQLADNATLCISPGKTLTIQNNMLNNDAKYNLTLELYGKLVMGNPEFNSNNLIMNIHSGGEFKTTGNAAFKGNNVIINNQGNFHVSVLNLNGNSGTINILNSEFAEFETKENLNVGNNVALIYNNKGHLKIGSQFGISEISKYSNCGVIETAGFNLMNGTVYNTGEMFISDKLEGKGEIYNYGKIELNAILGDKKKIHNYGTIDVLTNSIVDMEIFGPTGDHIYGEFRWKGQAGGVNNILVSGNQIFKNTAPNGNSSVSGMLQNSNALKPQSGSEIKWGDCSECIVVNENVDCIDAESGKSQKNFWYGTEDQDWNKAINWTSNSVPAMNEDIEFATEENNGLTGSGNGKGAAINDLYLDRDRTIGNLINHSNVDLVITTQNQLTINGTVKDENYEDGTIVVKADPEDEMPSGTLIFTNPDNNQHVNAEVEFYNKAYDCADCGFYTRSWQYFGIPVEESEFPASEVAGNETVNQWVEPFNGNKWQPAPYTPDTNLKAFKGYQITNDAEQQPEAVYGFNGTLNVGNVSVGLTQTANVNYTGVNLVGNSYTAAIPINGDAISFPTGVEQTVYLFNTGTRDQWRKLNGSAINQENYRSGQYLAVPVNVGGQNHFPDRIPSMHSFMVRVESGTGGNLEIDYSKLVKNTAVKLGDNSTEIVTRSATETTGTYSSSSSSSSASSIPLLVMDVIGEESADRVWIFAKEGTTHGFDNGWDGRKMTEGGIAQLYVTGSDNSKLQVATVPTFESIMLGFEADVDGKYTIEFALSDHWTTEELYLRDLATGTSERVANGGSYTFQAKKGDSGTRFSLSASGTPGEDESAKIVVQATDEGKIAISNNSNRNCTISISNTAGKLLQSLEVKAGDGDEVESLPKGSYVVRIQNAVVSDARKVIVD